MEAQHRVEPEANGGHATLPSTPADATAFTGFVPQMRKTKSQSQLSACAVASSEESCKFPSHPEAFCASKIESKSSFNQIRLQETHINVASLESVESKTEKWTYTAKNLSLCQQTPVYLRSVPITKVRHPLEENIFTSFLYSLLSFLLIVCLSIPLSVLILLSLPFTLMGRAVYLACSRNMRQACLACNSEYVSVQDSKYFLVDNQPPIHSVIVIDGTLDIKRIKNILCSRVVEAKNYRGHFMYPRLRQLVLHKPAGNVWSYDKDFSLNNHIFTGPALESEDNLRKYVATLLTQPLSNLKPLWEVIVISCFGRSKDTVLVCRIHQSIADGMSLMKLLCQSLSDNQTVHIPPKPHFGGTTYGVNALKAFLVGPLTLINWLWWLEDDVNILTVNSSRSHSTASSVVNMKGSNRCCGCKRPSTVPTLSQSVDKGSSVWNTSQNSLGYILQWTSNISTMTVVRIKQVTRTCLNDVLLSALSGALRMTLQKQGIANPPDVHASIAVDLRSVAPPFSKPSLGNKSSVVYVTLPLSCEGAIPRLWKVHTSMDEMKASADSAVSYGLVWWALKILPLKTVKRLLERLSLKSCTQFASLPGPTSTLLLGGFAVKSIFNVSFMGPPSGVSITVLTYSERVHISVVVKKSIPNARKIARQIVREMESQCHQMSQTLSHRRIPGEIRRIYTFGATNPHRNSSLSDLQEKLTQVEIKLRRMNTTYEREVRKSLQLKENQTKYRIGDERTSGRESRPHIVIDSKAMLAPIRSEPGLSPLQLASEIQSLKQEFTELLNEIHRRKSVSETGAAGTASCAIEDEDGEMRRPRKRTLSAASIRSASLVTSPQLHCRDPGRHSSFSRPLAASLPNRKLTVTHSESTSAAVVFVEQSSRSSVVTDINW